ncbi:MAG: hypothetical protein WC326_05345 [Candidatus Delongbacteria bacterium]
MERPATRSLLWFLLAALCAGGFLLLMGPAATAEAPKSASCGLCAPGAPACKTPAPRDTLTHHLTRPGKLNPHGRENRCAECHVAGAEPGAASFRGESCTECHDPVAHLREIHPTNFAGDNPKAPSFKGARLQEGRSTCLTCHNIGCKGDGNFRVHRENRAMLVGGPWPRETDFCYQCHERALYPQKNPHRTAGDPNLCWYCHAPGSDGQSLSPQPQLPAGELCLKCHKDVKHEREHLGRSVLHNRLKMDTASALKRFHDTSGVTLPLREGEFLTCTTCHTPNPACGQGVEPPPSKLLRAPKERICYACHDL